MNQIKAWPHLTIVAVLVAVLAGLGVAFYLKHEQTVKAEALPHAARIQHVDGEVALNNSLQNGDANAQWLVAAPNQPFSVGDRIYTRDNSRASLAFTGRNFARLNPNTELDVLELSDSRTQLALRDGSALFDVGYLPAGQLFEVGTPYGAVDFDQPGLYDVGFDNNGNVLVSVLSGLAQVVGLGGSGQISKGEMLTLLGQTAAQVALSRLDGRNAGYLIDDYYRYQYPNVYDGRYSSYDAYLSDPYYYDPYRRFTSYQYVNSYIPGIYDLDYYGDWQNLSGYGYGWRPRVDTGWVPYQQGYWETDYPYGLTWVSSEPWGYAPYHYGRWAFVNNQWYWIPDAVNTTPLYSPALVAFIPFNDANQIGWVPLGPGDTYVPRYYDANWQPYYLTRGDVTPSQLVNLRVPMAVTVVPVDSFGRTIDPRVVTRMNPQMLAQVNPTLEPLLLTPLRNAALHSAWGRGKIDLPPGIAKKLATPVITSAVPFAPPFRKDVATALRVQPVSEKAKNQKLNFKDERQAQSNQGQGQVPAAAAERKQPIGALAAEAAKGNRDARRQVQQLQQEQRKQEMEAQRAQRQAQQPRGERVGQPERQQPQKPIAPPPVQRAQPQPRRVAPPQPHFESRPQPRAPQVVDRPQLVNRPQVVQPARQPVATPQRQAVQQRQSSPVQQAVPAQKHEGHGPPSQPAAAAQGQGGGKGKGKRP
ncbi:MAG TPA: DUF6600 domain-containing protein [Pyrinomonadaceae bacterium]|nr:DUF6600 domain-containing protein [Pyrinomonadaceae bacterium]